MAEDEEEESLHLMSDASSEERSAHKPCIYRHIGFTIDDLSNLKSCKKIKSENFLSIRKKLDPLGAM